MTPVAMDPVVIGVVGSRRLLVATVAHQEGGGVWPLRVTRTDFGRGHVVDAAQFAGAQSIVLPETLARGDPLVAQALSGGLVVWIAPGPLVDAICRAAPLRGPARIAAAIARLPMIPFTRSQLRRLVPDHDRRQLKLL